jgi:hypothetical protein
VLQRLIADDEQEHMALTNKRFCGDSNGDTPPKKPNSVASRSGPEHGPSAAENNTAAQEPTRRDNTGEADPELESFSEDGAFNELFQASLRSKIVESLGTEDATPEWFNLFDVRSVYADNLLPYETFGPANDDSLLRKGLNIREYKADHTAKQATHTTEAGPSNPTGSQPRLDAAGKL